MPVTRTKPRTIRLLYAGPVARVCCFAVRSGKQETRYVATEVQGDWGRKFTVEKLGEHAVTVETYHVGLGEGDYGTDECDCPGGRKWRHCKHAEGLRALLNAGKLWEAK